MRDIVTIARICGTHHLKGVVKAFAYIDDIEFLDGQKVMVETTRGEKKILVVENAEWMNDEKILIKFEGIDSIESAKGLYNAKVIVRRELLGELSDDSYFVFDLIDMDIYTTGGEKVGKLDSIFTTSAHDIYIVIDENEKEIMIPAVDEFVKEIDFDNNKIIVELIEGMR